LNLWAGDDSGSLSSLPTIIHEGQVGADNPAANVRVIPGWMSLIPPVVAIALALILRSVIPAIFFGLWAAVIVARGFSPSDILLALLDSFQVFVLKALANEDHASVLLFSAMIGGMVGIISKNGGMQGIVNKVIRWACTPRRGQLSVWFLGLAIFFDDYTNTLAVGNSVRPITDRLRISREKVAFIVDSTAAPIAAIAVITTWIGYELGLIADVFSTIEGATEAPYTILLNSIPYSFYPILMIVFVFMIAWSGRDFGPMLKAEVRSYNGQGNSYKNTNSAMLDNTVGDDIPHRAINAILPIVSLVVSCVAGLFISGEGDTLRDLLSTGDVYKSLMWGSLISVIVAATLTMAQGIMKLNEVVSAWENGITCMVPPLVILILAWALAETTTALGTANYLVTLANGMLIPEMVPALAFILSAAAAFATGSSWGVMALMLPLIIPVAWSILMTDGGVSVDNMHIIYSTLASVLAGSIWGDHCSPISDTTVLSSLSTDCDHMEHVRTQMPYALTVGLVALLVCTIPTAYGVPWWLSLPAATLLLAIIVRVFGKHSY
jgi:Na+/H+ antiporter NhaC